MTIELPVVSADLTANYEIPAGATVTAKSGAWAIPSAYSMLMNVSPSVDRRLLNGSLAKYRAILERLPAQQRRGDPTVVLTELSASEGRIAEAENLRK